MENNLVRTTNMLGNIKNVVGNNTADLVLETLGKVYIKTGKQTRVLNDVFKLLEGINSNNGNSKTIITRNIKTIQYPGDGYLVFDTQENALYISYDQRYLLIIDGIDKEVKDMNLHESTLLAGIPNAPSVYSPNANPELSRQRHAQVINQMIKYEYLDKSTGEDLLKQIEK